MPDPVTGVMGGSALLGAGSANKAAKSQERAAEAQMALAREQFDTTRQDLQPFRTAGGNALSAYQFELGLGERPTFGGTAPQITTIPGTTQAMPQGNFRIADRDNPEGFYDERGGFLGGRPTAPPARYSVNGQMFDTMEQAQAFASANTSGGQQYGGISMSPGTRFAMEEGRDTIEAGAAARSGLNSGATLAGLERLRFGLSAQDREAQLNRLGGLAGMGQSAAAMQAANSANFTQNGMNALGGMGNAQAAGAIGVGNSLQNGLQNLAGSWGYQSAQQQPTQLSQGISLRPQARPF